MNRKLIVSVIAFAMVSVSFAIGVSVNVQAVSVLENLTTHPDADFYPKAIDWKDDGTMALVVGYNTVGGPNAWWYAPTDMPGGAWISVNNWPGAWATGYPLNDVIYDVFTNTFYMVGDEIDGATCTVCYLLPGSDEIFSLTGKVNAPVMDLSCIAANEFGNLMVGGDQYSFFYCATDSEFYQFFDGVQWSGVDYDEYHQRFYLAGALPPSKETGDMVICYTDPPTVSSSTVVTSVNLYDNLTNMAAYLYPSAITWNNNPRLGDDNYGVIACAGTLVGISPIELSPQFHQTNAPTYEYLDVAFDESTWAEATAVGVYSTYWYIVQFSNKTKRFTELASYTSPLYCVGYKPPSSPGWGMVVASTPVKVNINAFDQSTTITVNAVFPKLYWVGFNETDLPRTSRMQQQVPPDTSYYFRWCYNYSEGYLGTQTEILAWYDHGITGGGSSYAPAVEDRCLAFAIVYDPNTMTANLNYPVGAPFEFGLGLVADNFYFQPVLGDPDQDWRVVEVEVLLGPQTRSADGSGWAVGGVDFDQSRTVALNDPFSWDFNITVRDTGQHSAYNSSYGEFGIDDYVLIMASGNPTGNAPPGSMNVALMDPSVITYSANDDYWVNVSIPDLAKDGNQMLGPWITADHLKVQNTHVDAVAGNSDLSLPSYFPGPDIEQCVWGLALPSPLAPTSNGTITAGPWRSDFNSAGVGDTTIVDWWVDVLGTTPEGIYYETITFSIETL